MIQAKLLNSFASLNDYLYLGSLDFVPGENVKVAIQLFDAQRGTRLVPPLAATLTMSFIDKDGVTFVKTATVVSADDRSMWSVTLSQVESQVLAGQNIIVKLDYLGDAIVIYTTLMQNVMIRNNLSGDC